MRHRNNRLSTSKRTGHNQYQRFNPSQLQRLEEFFKDYHHPDQNQQFELSQELGIEPNKVKFWLQNKRTQEKVLKERQENNALLLDNEKFRRENLYLSTVIRNSHCGSCIVPENTRDNQQSVIDKLKRENSQLNARLREIYNDFSKKIGIQSNVILAQLSVPVTPAGLLSRSVPVPVPSINSIGTASQKVQTLEKPVLLGIAMTAFDEVSRLLKYDAPLWNKDEVMGRNVLDHESYTKIYPKPNPDNFHGLFESSKDDGFVRMAGKQLVDVFLDVDKWEDFFSTVIIKAEMIQKFESGTPEIRHGCLQLMYEKMHTLSPLAAPREFCFLRYCQQIDNGVWVITDVTDDYFFKENHDSSPFLCWRLPSGCMIEDMSNGWSKVTWIEHIKLDGKTTSHRLYRDFLTNGLAYGAERWLVTLKRTCERFAFTMMQSIPRTLGGPDLGLEGRKGITRLSRKMVKIFCECLAMKGKEESAQTLDSKDGGVEITHKHIEGHPDGIIIMATSSIWLPLPLQTVFNYLLDNNRRNEWDVLSGGKLIKEAINISYGTHPGNSISIFQPFSPDNSNLVMLQETCIDPLGSLLVYAPIDIATLNLAMSTGQDYSSNICILPSGFVVSPDGNFGNEDGASSSSITMTGSGSSLLTMSCQLLVGELSSPIAQQSIANVEYVIGTTLQKIKFSLGCSDFN